MSLKKSGLGRGLSNLIPDAPATRSTSGSGEFQYLSLDDIDPNPDQPRRTFKAQELQELADTIQSVGVIEPIIVRRKGERFLIISGERRWRASRLVGYKKIPALVKDVDDVRAAEFAIIENIQREDLSPVEEARAYESLMTLTGDKAGDLAKKVGKDRTTIANLLRLLKLPEDVLKLVEEKQISAGQARPLLSLGDRKVIVQLAGRIAREGWSARRVEDEVAKLGEDHRSGPVKAQRKDANTRKMEERMRARLAARVDLKHRSDGKGRITIQYGSLDDLERILELMGVRLSH